MHAKPDLRVFLKWIIAGSGSVITDVITPKIMAKQITAIVGILLLSVAWLCSALSVWEVFGVVNGTQIDASEVAAARNTLPSLLSGYVVAGLSAMFGILLLGVSIDGMGYRPAWLLRALAGLGVIWLPFYAAGTMVGVAIILYSLMNYRKFHPKPTTA